MWNADRHNPHSTLLRTGVLSRQKSCRDAQLFKTAGGRWLEDLSQGCATPSRKFTPRFGPWSLCCYLIEFPLYPELPCLRDPPLKTENLDYLPRRQGYGWRYKQEWSVGPPRTMEPRVGRLLTRTVSAGQVPGARRVARQDTTLQAGHRRPNPSRGSGPRICWGKLDQ